MVGWAGESFALKHASVVGYGSIWVALFNLGCNMQNDNVICKMAMHFYIYIYIFQYICATFGAK